MVAPVLPRPCDHSLAGPRETLARSPIESCQALIGFRPWVTAAGNPDITNELLKGKPLGEQTYKVHLDGYDKTDLLTGQGAKRHEVWYFAQTRLGALRMDNYKYQFIEQPEGWIGPVVRPNMPILTNLRQDPSERMNWPGKGFAEGSIAYWDSFKQEM
jgi:hypothetical protein